MLIIRHFGRRKLGPVEYAKSRESGVSEKVPSVENKSVESEECGN